MWNFLLLQRRKREKLLRELITAGNRLWVDCRALMMRNNLQGGHKPDQFNSVYSSYLWCIERRSLYQKCSVFMWSISRILNIAKFKHSCTVLLLLLLLFIRTQNTFKPEKRQTSNSTQELGKRTCTSSGKMRVQNTINLGDYVQFFRVSLKIQSILIIVHLPV